MKKKILITTGGSGGHVLPALTIYDHLKTEHDMFISSDQRGLKYFETDDKTKLILIGSISLILMQATIHIGVNIRLFPTTGMTLPFLSYGGSSIISTSILAGIILKITKGKKIEIFSFGVSTIIGLYFSVSKYFNPL